MSAITGICHLVPHINTNAKPLGFYRPPGMTESHDDRLGTDDPRANAQFGTMCDMADAKLWRVPLSAADINFRYGQNPLSYKHIVSV